MSMQLITAQGAGTGSGNTIGDSLTYVAVDTAAKTITLAVDGQVQQVFS